CAAGEGGSTATIKESQPLFSKNLTLFEKISIIKQYQHVKQNERRGEGNCPPDLFELPCLQALQYIKKAALFRYVQVSATASCQKRGGTSPA
ncbi:MAG: hypothetical protein ABJM82_16095, partial [Shimia thalassica]|uniref:hypothetical protein n=1 Tax=Shimia thalassica TaxID=1715693 RepID=UPI0032968D86